jgi:ABC-type glycerol-3-phosphate transport system substrate-binding protein
MKWEVGRGSFGEQFEALVEEFDQTHPGIVMRPSYAGTLWTVRDKLFAAVASDAAPCLAQDTATFNGKVWSMPLSLSNIALYCNRALFEAADPEPDHAPANWEELTAFAAALTADTDGDSQTDLWGLSFPSQANQGVVYDWFAFLWQAGSEIFSEDLKTSRFQETPGVEALICLQGMVKAGSIPLALPEEGFEQGKSG